MSASSQSETGNYRRKKLFFPLFQIPKDLLKLYKDNPDFVIPGFRLQEITNLSPKVYRIFHFPAEKQNALGVPVPNDPEQVMYVWFDALVNYISTLGWPENKKELKSGGRECRLPAKTICASNQPCGRPCYVPPVCCPTPSRF